MSAPYALEKMLAWYCLDGVFWWDAVVAGVLGIYVIASHDRKRSCYVLHTGLYICLLWRMWYEQMHLFRGSCCIAQPGLQIIILLPPPPKSWDCKWWSDSMCEHVYEWVCVWTCMHEHVCVHMCECVCMSVHVWVCVWYKCVYWEVEWSPIPVWRWDRVSLLELGKSDQLTQKSPWLCATLDSPGMEWWGSSSSSTLFVCSGDGSQAWAAGIRPLSLHLPDHAVPHL
jgi:hypothetical protein